MIRTIQTFAANVCITLALAGCAGVTAVPAPPGSPVQGIRIYEQKPLLIVSGLQISVVFVPNTSRAYALQFYSFLAKHDLTANFTPSGSLSILTSNQDTTAVAVALVNLVNKAVEKGTSIGTAFSGTSAPTLNERVQIYDFVFDDNGELSQLRPLINQKDLLRMPRQKEGVTFSGTEPGTVQKIPLPTTESLTQPPIRDLN
jgi:hypothetical protein